MCGVDRAELITGVGREIVRGNPGEQLLHFQSPLVSEQIGEVFFLIGIGFEIGDAQIDLFDPPGVGAYPEKTRAIHKKGLGIAEIVCNGFSDHSQT